MVAIAVGYVVSDGVDRLPVCCHIPVGLVPEKLPSGVVLFCPQLGLVGSQVMMNPVPLHGPVGVLSVWSRVPALANRPSLTRALSFGAYVLCRAQYASWAVRSVWASAAWA